MDPFCISVMCTAITLSTCSCITFRPLPLWLSPVYANANDYAICLCPGRARPGFFSVELILRSVSRTLFSRTPVFEWFARSPCELTFEPSALGTDFSERISNLFLRPQGSTPPPSPPKTFSSSPASTAPTRVIFHRPLLFCFLLPLFSNMLRFFAHDLLLYGYYFLLFATLYLEAFSPVRTSRRVVIVRRYCCRLYGEQGDPFSLVLPRTRYRLRSSSSPSCMPLPCRLVHLYRSVP